MKIGFDIDGVIATQEPGIFIPIRDSPVAQEVYYSSRQPELLPSMFCHKDDKAYIITARKKELKQITKDWCKLHFPGLTVIQLNTPEWNKTSEIKVWMKGIAEVKAEKINELQLDVYFEDMPETVIWLRNLCPNCKIIQYGGRV
jgi:hypothetical protein